MTEEKKFIMDCNKGIVFEDEVIFDFGALEENENESYLTTVVKNIPHLLNDLISNDKELDVNDILETINRIKDTYGLFKVKGSKLFENFPEKFKEKMVDALTSNNKLNNSIKNYIEYLMENDMKKFNGRKHFSDNFIKTFLKLSIYTKLIMLAKGSFLTSGNRVLERKNKHLIESVLCEIIDQTEFVEILENNIKKHKNNYYSPKYEIDENTETPYSEIVSNVIYTSKNFSIIENKAGVNHINNPYSWITSVIKRSVYHQYVHQGYGKKSKHNHDDKSNEVELDCRHLSDRCVESIFENNDQLYSFSNNFIYIIEKERKYLKENNIKFKITDNEELVDKILYSDLNDYMVYSYLLLTYGHVYARIEKECYRDTPEMRKVLVQKIAYTLLEKDKISRTKNMSIYERDGNNRSFCYRTNTKMDYHLITTAMLSQPVGKVINIDYSIRDYDDNVSASLATKHDIYTYDKINSIMNKVYHRRFENDYNVFDSGKGSFTIIDNVMPFLIGQIDLLLKNDNKEYGSDYRRIDNPFEIKNNETEREFTDSILPDASFE